MVKDRTLEGTLQGTLPSIPARRAGYSAFTAELLCNQVIVQFPQGQQCEAAFINVDVLLPLHAEIMTFHNGLGLFL